MFVRLDVNVWCCYRCVVGGVLRVVCGVGCVLCGVWCVVCGVRCGPSWALKRQPLNSISHSFEEALSVNFIIQCPFHLRGLRRHCLH